MKLYGFPLSPNTRKVQALVLHLGLSLDFHRVDLLRGESRTPEYLALNPNGRAPALVDGDFVLWESNAIMQYLASKQPTQLWPEDARARADITRWQCWQLAQWNEGCAGLIYENFLKQLAKRGDPDPAAVKRAGDAFRRDAAVLDAHLAKSQYLVGDRLTLADFSVASYLAFAGPAKMPLAEYQNVVAWSGRIDAVPAWQQTVPRP